MRRALPIVTFLMASLIAGGSAWAINLLLGRWISPGALPDDRAVVASAAQPRTPRARAMPIDDYLQGIMGRNLFDKEVIATWHPQTETPGGVVVAKSELHVKLILVFVAVPETLSSALILDEDSKDYPKAYSIGDQLYDRTVKSIEKDQVALVKPDGEVEYLTLGDAVVQRHDEGGDTVAADEGDGSVTQTGENRFSLSKETFDKNINDLESISKMGRALLHRGPDGEYDGYRLSAIRRGTLADQLGIKNGDIIHSVNGESLNSMQAAMNAYNTMKTQSSFCFEISRRGSPTELCYDVR